MSKEPAADVSVLIVNYGTVDLVLTAIGSVVEHSARVRDIHVVDNASPNGDAAILAREIAARGWQGQVTLHAETTNHGFGRGNNVVLAALARQEEAPDKVFLLNPDAQVVGDTIRTLAEFMDAHPRAGAAGARLEHPGHTPAADAFRFPSLISTLSDAVSFGPFARLCAKWQVPLPPGQPTSRVDWVCGAAVMLRLQALREAGLFDPEFFLYYEEVDLMRQFAGKGWETWYVNTALAIHDEGVSTGVKPGRPERKRLPPYWYHSWQYYLRKNHGRGLALLACLAWAGGAGVNFVISTLRGKSPAAPRHLLGDLWTHAARPLLGLDA